MATWGVLRIEYVEHEINRLENMITNLKLELQKMQSECKHDGKREKLSTTLEICARCHKKFAIPPTTSIFPPSARVSRVR
ncbi:MAG: hypothetical protein HYT65_02840 [Candidatus Yanofskybacteria bacterium]|nr:hypothetical protein [Candidatus Yanofskybacteria bacterium]